MAIHEAMRLYGIENKRACFEKVLVMAGYWIGKLRER